MYFSDRRYFDIFYFAIADISTFFSNIIVDISTFVNISTRIFYNFFMQIGSLLKELRNNLDKSQQEIADTINISRSVLSQYENNLVEPTANVIKKFATYFEVSADFLLGLEDDFGIRTAAPISDGLSSEERRLINQYRTLPDKIKKTIRDQIEIYSEPNELVFKSDKKV